MSANDRSDGLLRALQDLPEAERDRIVKHLPPEEVQNVFSILLRKQAGGSVPQAQPLVQTPTALHQVVSADESSAAPKKRSSSAASVHDSKRVKTETAEQQEADNAAVPVAVNKEPEFVDLVSEDEESEPEANRLPEPEIDGQPANAQAKVKEEREPADLPIYLRVRSEGGQTILKDIDDLPVLVQAELKRRYKEMWSAFKGRKEYYATITNNPGNYTRNPEKPWCIRNLVVRGSRGEVPSFSKGGSFRNTADDRCVRALEPCAHFAGRNGEYIIRMVPLPSTLREGKDWRDLGYWVLSESG